MTDKPDDLIISIGWTDLLSLEMKIRYAKRHLAEAVLFAHGDIANHIDEAYVDLVRATDLILKLIKGNDQA